MNKIVLTMVLMVLAFYFVLAKYAIKKVDSLENKVMQIYKK